MPRQLIAILVTCYAIAFAFGAFTAVRWPSIMMVVAMMADPSRADAATQVNWRELGLAHGAPYMLAALCFYAASAMIAKRRKGGVLWFLMGLVSGFPVIFLVTFERNWWQDPSAAEGAVAGAAAGALLLLLAVWELRFRKPKPVAAAPTTNDLQTQVELQQEQLLALKALTEQAHPPKRKPVPAAIARQRASFAYHGRKMKSR